MHPTAGTGNTAPPRPFPSGSAGSERSLGDSAFGPSAFEAGADRNRPRTWIGWRRRALVLTALLGCVAAFSLVRWLAAMPQVAGTWQSGAQGQLVLGNSPLAALQAQRGQVLLSIAGAGGEPTPVDARILHRALRWQPDEAARAAQIAQQQGWSRALGSGTVQLRFADGSRVTLQPAARGPGGLGWLFWPLLGLALVVFLLGFVMVLARPQAGSLLFAAIAVCQALNLLAVALEAAPGPGLLAATWVASLPGRVALDLVSAAAALQAWTQAPRRLPRAGLALAAGWAVLPAWLALTQISAPGLAGEPGAVWPLWWCAQSACLLLAAAALAAISHSYRMEPNPYALVMRRFAAITTLAFAAATVAVAATAGLPGTGALVAEGVSVGWSVGVAILLLMVPALGHSRQLLREFMLLAGISTVATALDLLFIAVFSLESATSLTLAVFIALALYAGARQWLVSHLLGGSILTTERTFDHLYRAAREVQARPARYVEVLGTLLQDLFEPLEVRQVERVPSRSRTVGNGAALVVPLRSTDDEAVQAGALVLRFAHRGQRLFTIDDARLADRVVDQLRRAVAYDQAVERGRSEERLRIAQDLHDDIGARLLTLMYQAQSREMEDYIRHTLQDLKTLTRGLAASEHRLSHAAAEWKADLTQRLAAAHASLGWRVDQDQDLLLSVVQWSALTRVLRELVSNALYHGHATHVDVSFQLEKGVLSLQVADDGEGSNPQAWAHGLGLGGVRKRIKLLGGQVAWRGNTPQGIVCAVRVPGFSGRR